MLAQTLHRRGSADAALTQFDRRSRISNTARRRYRAVRRGESAGVLLRTRG